MDLSQQLTNYMGLQKQYNILSDEKDAVQNEIDALFSSISNKLTQYEDVEVYKCKIKEGVNLLNIGKKFYSFHVNEEFDRISFLEEIEPIIIT